jgi:hypothetical protein
MMMATCLGVAKPPTWTCGGAALDILILRSPFHRASHGEDFLFLGSQHLVDVGDYLIGHLLHLIG